MEEKIGSNAADLFVVLGFDGSLTGAGILRLGSAGCIELVQAVAGEELESDQFDEMKKETVCEMGNILINAVVGTFANMLDKKVTYQLRH